MNQALGGRPWHAQGGFPKTGFWLPAPPYRTFQKLAGMNNPEPSRLFVLIDEHPDSINDGWNIMNPTSDAVWVDFPANYHNGACGYAFADGHAEIKKWTDPVPRDEPVLQPRGPSGRNRIPNHGARKGRQNDYWWVIERSTALINKP